MIYQYSIFLFPFVAQSMLYGINPSIKIKTGIQFIRSPRLMWSENNAYIAFKYDISCQNTKVLLKTVIFCYKDLEGKRLQKTGTRLSVFRLPKMQEKKCFRHTYIRYKRDQCQTFRIEIIIKAVDNDIITLSDVEFGGPQLCDRGNPYLVPKTLKCDFEKDDCGIRTDFCSLHEWTIRERSKGKCSRWLRRASKNDDDDDDDRSPFEIKGLRLARRNISSTFCSYDPICIPCFQPSGISTGPMLEDHDDDKSGAPEECRDRRMSGNSLFLDPRPLGGRAAGPTIFDFPNVQHHPANAFLSFVYEMGQEGKHQLIIRAVCTSRDTRDLIPLAPLRLHYRIDHFDHLGRGGLICLDVHRYVHRSYCSKFAMQFVAIALTTPISVDDISYEFQLSGANCSKNTKTIVPSDEWTVLNFVSL